MSYQLLVGVDWASASHQVCVLDADGKKLRERAVAHWAQEVTAFVDWVIEQAGGDPGRVAVAIELPRGALVEALLDRGLHVYSINPKQLDRFRDRYSVAGAKDDRLDAYVLADALRNDRQRMHRVELDDPLVVQIRELSRAYEDLRKELSGLSNRLRGQIHRCAPHLLELSPATDEPWFWDLVGRLYGPRSTSGLSQRTVQQLLKRHRIRRLSADDVVAVLRQSPIALAPGATEAARMHIRLLLPRLQVVHEQRKLCLEQLEALLDQFNRRHNDDGPSDGEILGSLPGAGPIVLATLIAEASVLLRERNGAGLRRYAGPAPVTRRSGKGLVVMMRRGCNARLRNALYHMARVSVTCDPAARAYYASLRARGHTHGRALRSVADRWIRILMAMLRDRTLYNAGHSRQAAVEAAA